MKVLVDTPVWSEFFRRGAPKGAVVHELRNLVEEGDALLMGPVRQEILSGVRNDGQFERLRAALRAFPDVKLLAGDHESAAQMFNLCRAQGIQGSNTDFLICAVSERLNTPIFTLDQDFARFQSALQVRLHKASG